MAVVVSRYMAAIAGAEAILVFWGVVPGIICHAIIIQVLLSHYISISAPSSRDQGDPNASFWFAHALPILALVPLLRILSVTVPMRGVGQIYWYAMVGAPLLLAAALAARLLDLSPASLGLRLCSWPRQTAIALSGLPLGLAAFLIVRPEPLFARPNWREVAIGSAVLLVFTGFTEELIFRGMLQSVANEIFGRAGILWSSALFAAMYLGSGSPSYTILIGLVGMFFGWCVNRTGSIWGVALAHALLTIGMLLVYPTVWR